MKTINITNFKYNIWTHFDTLISTREPIFVKRRNHVAIVLPLDKLSENDISTIIEIRKNAEKEYIEVTDEKLVWIFNNVTWSKSDKVILW